VARLHEYQGKALLAKAGIAIPEGGPAGSDAEAGDIAAGLAKPVVVKMQAWTTKRADQGGIQFADDPAAAKRAAAGMLGRRVGQFTVEKVLVEEKLPIRNEYYAAVLVDDAARRPLVLFATGGGTGIEDRAAAGELRMGRMYADALEGLPAHRSRELLRSVGISGKLQMALAGVVTKLVQTAQQCESRTAEINPLVVTEDGKVVAADCRFTIDDYAVFRHPELGIEIAREMDHPPTELERIAFQVEAKDYRGTFFFGQLADGFKPGDRHIGFHGAGGGGSMMSMDAVSQAGFKIANFTDTSGNPSASKVYRAAMIILAQRNIDGYFGSGSGVASQEQFHSARGLAKAFREAKLWVPAVIRLGGNSEDKAVQILAENRDQWPAPIEGYKKDDSPSFCAERFKKLVDEQGPKPPPAPEPMKVTPKPDCYSFETVTGRVHLDHATCDQCESKVCIEQCVPQILKLDNGRPVLNISEEDAAKGKCIECLACEVSCRTHGAGGGYVELPIPGLDEYRATLAASI
jgi:succinyl-CoA synthetase beta subunit